MYRAKLALLCYRVARWLAPQLFKLPDFTVKAMREYQKELATEWVTMPAKKRYDPRGIYVQERLAAINREVDRLELLSAQYEEVKIEIRYDPSTHVLSKEGRAKLRDDPKLSTLTVIQQEIKQQLFSAMVAGFAQSAEIDLHLYFREVNKDLTTIGIRLYFKHGQ